MTNSTFSFDSTHADGARWYDQKVTPENLATIASAVVALTQIRSKSSFTRFDLLEVSSFNQAMIRDYGKPALNTESAQNEYDKLCSQNLNLLAFAGVLSSTSGKPRRYEVADLSHLNLLADNEPECRVFLIEYLEWILRKFGWWHNFETYVDSPHQQEDLDTLKKKFTNLLINTMGLGNHKGDPKVEAGRIFQKILNLLAYQYYIPGIQRGRVMPNPPSRYDLTYNRPNWRDQASKKPKNLTRKAYLEIRENAAASQVGTNVKTAAMKKVRDYHNFVSEVPDTSGVRATHVHHIFPQSQFKDLADVLENMIALTPGQHLGEAHPHGNTQRVDPSY